MWDDFHTGATFVTLAQLHDKVNTRGPEDEVIQKLVRRTCEMALDGSLAARQFGQTLWAMAKLKDEVPEFADAVPSLIGLAQYSNFKGQALSHALWAAATVGLEKDKDGIEALVTAVVERMSTDAEQFMEQALSNILWAAATIDLDKQKIQPI
eukprot:2585363-Amphidinium_carterae.1